MLRGVGAGLVSSSCTSGRKGPGPKRSELTPGPGPEGTSTIVPTTGGHHPAGPRGVKAALRVSRGGPSPPSDSSLTPAHLAPAPSGVKLWDWGAPPRAQPPCPQCNRGSSPKTTSPPAEQAVTGTAGPARPSQALDRPGPLDPAPEPVQRDRPTKTRSARLGRPGPVDGPGFRAVRPERVTATGGSRRAARGSGWKEVVPAGQGGRQQVPTSGPDQGSCLLPASWQRRDRTLEKATAPWFAP
jgi:hypothetical protein